MRIRIACGLDSRSLAGFWKNDGESVRAVRTIQYNNLLFYLLFIIVYNIYNLLFIRLAVVTHNWIVSHQSVFRVGKGRLKERCGLEPRTNFFFRLRNRQKLVRIRFENIRYFFNAIIWGYDIDKHNILFVWVMTTCRLVGNLCFVWTYFFNFASSFWGNINCKHITK